MKAVGYRESLPIDHLESLLDLDLPEPGVGERDLLVEVKAVAVNPVDTKVRLRAQPAPGEVKVLGWDASGVVRAVGSEVTAYKPGDRVWYAGSINRQGSNSALQRVDERIVGRMPATLDFAAAAALPLTSITAWELLFDRLQIARTREPAPHALLVIGAAGGVGSILVQLARQLTGLTIVGTASRAETRDWVLGLGAHHVIDHSKPLLPQLKEIDVPQVRYVASLTQTDAHFSDIVEALEPQGRFGLIDDPKPIDIGRLKQKSVSLHWESMFTRAVFETPDMIEQQRLLNQVAALVDEGRLRSTIADHFGTINAANLKRAHALLESGKSRGKIVLEGF